MAIYIKGVEMPTNCLTCPFTEADDRMGTICYFTNIAVLNIGIQKDCPLVYIPEPHGRLIDADELSKKLCETTIFIEDGETFQRMINDAPTVIEGSE